jgi:hypothetical protein
LSIPLFLWGNIRSVYFFHPSERVNLHSVGTFRGYSVVKYTQLYPETNMLLIIYDCILRKIHPNNLLRSIQFGALYLENNAMKLRTIA